MLFSAHIGGTKNDLADALSRNDNEYSFTHYSHAGTSKANPIATRAAGPHNNSEARMDIAALDQLVVHYFQAGLAPSTQRSYDSANYYVRS